MPGCNSNNTPPNTLSIQYFTSPTCFDCGNDCGGQIYNSKCIIYTGPNLGCSGVNTNDSLETAIQKIDEQICSIIGDYSTYNMNCLPTYWGEAITTQAEFVDAITSYTCDTQSQLTEFIDETFSTYEAATEGRLVDLEIPGITCSFAGAVNTDTLVQILNKYCTAFTTLDDKFDISSVTWDECYTVISAPTTLSAAFQLLADQICDTKALITNYGLPLFNNSTSCLEGTSSDTLVTTIGLITTRLCTSPTFDINALDWGCLVKPSSVQTDLQSAFQTVLDSLSGFTEQSVTWSEDFVVTATDEENPCAGISVALATPLNIDRYVAATALDATPGTLQDKLVEGDNITLDFSSDTEVVISADLGNVYKVKANAAEADGDADYLDEKMTGGSNSGITITTSYDSGDKKVTIVPGVDPEDLWTTLYNYIKTTSSAQELFCDLGLSCPAMSTSSFTWSFDNQQDAVSGTNVFTVTNVTNPSTPAVVFSTSLSTTTTLSSSTPVTLISGNLYKVEITWVAGNNYGDIEIIDDTLGMTIYSTTEYNATNPNVAIFTASAGHSYIINITTGNNS